eukprot:SAG11_NODE_29344_length_311_cov_69.146226_1_plen_84_part_10
MGVVIMRLSNSKHPGEDILYATPEAQLVIQQAQIKGKKKVKSKVVGDSIVPTSVKTVSEKSIDEQIAQMEEKISRLLKTETVSS